MELFKNILKSITGNKGKQTTSYAFGIPLYSDYEHKPFINPERTKQDLQRMYDERSTFPGVLVQKEAITFYKSLGIFRGDIIVLNWTMKNNEKNKKIPQYFETRYGVDFFESIARLENNGYLISRINNSFSEKIQILVSITSKGHDLLVDKSEIIFSNDSHHNGLTDSELMNQAKLEDSKTSNEAGETLENNPEMTKLIEEFRGKSMNNKIREYSILDSLSNVQFQNYMNKRLMADRIAIDDKDYDKSNEILWEIYKNIKYTNFDRLEKNYRKLKKYDKEIEVIKMHIKSIEAQEFETDFNGKKIAHLNERLLKTISLRNNKK